MTTLTRSDFNIMPIIAMGLTLIIILITGDVNMNSYLFQIFIQSVALTLIMLAGFLTVYYYKFKQKPLVKGVSDLNNQIDFIRKIDKNKLELLRNNLKKQLYTDDKLMNIAKLSILTELELQNLINKTKLEPEKLTFQKMTYELYNNGKIDDLTKKYLYSLNSFRNKAIHGERILDKDYSSFVELTNFVLFNLRNK